MPTTLPRDVAPRLTATGFAFVHGADVRAALGPLPDWARFAASWNALPLDPYMADGGRYRRRRHARMACDAAGVLTRLAHAPHYQSTEYNRLNGGIERLLAPIADTDATSPTLAAIIGWAHGAFQLAAPAVAHWLLEVHQFRIETTPAAPGHPTPEGVHRDGVDFALALLIERVGVREGTTTVHDAAGASLGAFTLAAPLDAALLDDHRVWHGVTPIVPLDGVAAGHRDVLVVTFTRA